MYLTAAPQWLSVEKAFSKEPGAGRLLQPGHVRSAGILECTVHGWSCTGSIQPPLLAATKLSAPGT